jgi:hypothetical protein
MVVFLRTVQNPPAMRCAASLYSPPAIRFDMKVQRGWLACSGRCEPTFANALIAKTHERLPSLRIGKLSWAWKLKQICHELYAWAGLREPEFYETEPGASLREVVLPIINKSPRQIWIDFGTPAVREKVYEDTWVDYVLKNEHPYDVLIIPDTRFLNEAGAVMAQGGELLKVVRPGFGPGFGPGPNRPDRELLGYKGWTNVFGETGQLRDLLMWADRYASWLAVAPSLGGRKLVEIDGVLQRPAC